jgi:lipase
MVATDVPYTRQSVTVAGGELAVAVWGDTGPLVVAAHGVTGTHQTWALVGADLGRDHRVIAPDLRGRGASRDLPSPYGMAAHAADLAAVVKAYGGGPALLLGHSMGGFAVVRTARDFPALVSRVVLVDGGAPFPLPDGVGSDPEQLEEALAAVVGPAFARLSMTFSSYEDYQRFWRRHPAFTRWHPVMASYADYDLVGEPPELRPSCRPEAAMQDSRDLYPGLDQKPARLPVPGVFLRAERGVLNEPDKPMYEAGRASTWLPGVVESTVPGTNHYTITLSDHGAEAVVAAVRQAGAA